MFPQWETAFFLNSILLLPKEYPLFGKKRSNKPYIERIGSYAILINEDHKIGIVEATNANYFMLPGGGIEIGEDPIEALKREVLEETGYQIEAQNQIGIAGEYFFEKISGLYYKKIGLFYHVKLLAIAPITIIEPYHVFYWMDIKMALKKLFHPSQVWAVEHALK